MPPVLTIQSLNHAGQGVCHVDGLVTFVDGALPGDLVEIRIRQKKQNYATADIVRILEASKDRIDPACPLADRCGGCQLQPLSYEAQLTYKQQTVIDQLVRIGGLPTAEAEQLTRPCLPAPDRWSYRNKAQYPVAGLSSDPQIGFYETRSHRIVDGDVCPVQHPVSNQLRAAVRTWVKQQDIRPYDETSGKGLLRHLMTRVGFVTKEVMVVLVVNAKTSPKIPGQAELLSALEHSCNELGFKLKAVFVNLNPKQGNLILGREYQRIYGDDFITEELLGLRYRISPPAFFQINPSQTAHLYQEVLALADLRGDERVYDLYCGTGSISLLLAKYAKEVIGIEIIPDAIRDAEANARLNDIHNASFYVGAAEREVPKLYREGKIADLVVVDPPRKGCDPRLLETMLEMCPEKIIYVSCNPATLARDLKILTAGPYVIRHVQPVDMFPWTSHVETIVLLQRADT